MLLRLKMQKKKLIEFLSELPLRAQSAITQFRTLNIVDCLLFFNCRFVCVKSRMGYNWSFFDIVIFNENNALTKMKNGLYAPKEVENLIIRTW